MGLKSNSLLVMVMVVGALGAAAPLMVEAQLGIIGNLLGLTRIQGTVFCTANGNIDTNATSTPFFPNAAVQLQCGNGNIVSTTTTNNMGIFSMSLNSMQFLLSLILSSCNLVVKTPLSNCNVTLPSTGILMSPLQYLGKFVEGIFEITNITANSFTFLLSL